MKKNINIKHTYSRSDKVVAKKIEDDLVIVPLISGIGNLDSELYSLNRTGTAIWEKLDGKSNLESIIHELAGEFDSEFDQMKDGIINLMEDLQKKDLIFNIENSE